MAVSEFSGNWTLNCSCLFNNETTNQDTCNIMCKKLSNQQNHSGSSSIVVPISRESLNILHLCYVIIMLIGILGNTLTCYVIVHRRSMRRAIHLYTFNLAVTDLLILIFYVPTQMSMIENQFGWTLGLEMCRINYIVLPVALTSSIGTLSAITIDRFRGLVTPFSWRADSQKHAKIIIPITWVVSFILCTPLFIFPKLDTYIDLNNPTASVIYCSEGWPQAKYSNWFWVSNFVIVFAIPLVIIVTTQVAMLVTMSKEISATNRQQNRRMVRMVIALVLVFTTCTGFQHVFYFINTYGSIKLSIKVYALLFCSSNLVVSLQAALNPIIYGTLRQDFKKGYTNVLVMILIKCKLHKKALNENGNSTYTSRVLSSYFSEQSSVNHRRTPSKKYRQVSMMFQKKNECQSPTSSIDSPFSWYGTPPQSFFAFPNSETLSSDCDSDYHDSPRVSQGDAFFKENDVTLVGYRKSIKSTVVTTLHKNLIQKYAYTTETTDIFEGKNQRRRSSTELLMKNTDFNRNTGGDSPLIDNVIRFKFPVIIDRLNESKETDI